MMASLDQNSAGTNTEIRLPAPRLSSNVSIEEALQGRRSIRQYANKPLTLQDVSQLLWSVQGITNERGFRTAPSAGATFPLEIYLMANNVTGLSEGIYHYMPANNRLRLVHSKDVARDLTRASLGQSMVHEAGAVIIFGAVFERTTQRYGERGNRYVYNEIGHASQNAHLQAVALNLGTVVIGAFRDQEVEQILNLEPNVRVLYLMPVGKLN
ncbi:MAG TPA: SagB/ThcOx family dehydrogenase [Dissulfurispiraceae bacterium]|nr:SagB/ThcOx family dehydrogenase [Dissulfurispiraceae bacterium]